MSENPFVEAAAAVPADKHQGYLEPPLVNTAPRLVIFATSEQAWSAGFRGPGMRHERAPWIFGWALGHDVDLIRYRQWSEVIFTEGAQRRAFDNATVRMHLEIAKQHARAMLRLEPMLWIEL